MDNMILLTTVSTEFDMEIIKAKLLDAGIECFVQFQFNKNGVQVFGECCILLVI